ncbi:MAG TPA: hypothetical protein VG965_03195 [Patescibacteria group bacterium]|nr:hypothetical protein [Patescibacteria group bacterium]
MQTAKATWREALNSCFTVISLLLEIILYTFIVYLRLLPPLEMETYNNVRGLLMEDLDLLTKWSFYATVTLESIEEEITERALMWGSATAIIWTLITIGNGITPNPISLGLFAVALFAGGILTRIRLDNLDRPKIKANPY